MALARVVFLVVVVAAGAAGEVRAEDCADVTSVEGTVAAREPPASRASFLENDTEVVVPCALIDSGAFGMDCVDAFYVLNPQGVTLCRVSLWSLVDADDTPALETHDDASQSPMGSWAVGLMPERGIGPQPPVARMIEGPLAHWGGARLEGFRRMDPRPS